MNFRLDLKAPPFFSIILPCYNAERRIASCIKSIISQSRHDFELILVDGCSNDNTIEVTKKYVNHDERVILVSEKDGGVYDAMNKGIDMASGQWLYFIGSDDYFINSDVLFRVHEYITKTPGFDFYYGNVSAPPSIKKQNYYGEFTLERLTKYNICHQAIFYHRSLFARFGKYNLEYSLFADWEFNLRCLLHPGVRFSYMDQMIAHFGFEGLTSKSTDRKFLRDLNRIILKYGFRKLDRSLLKRTSSELLRETWRLKWKRKMAIDFYYYLKVRVF